MSKHDYTIRLRHMLDHAGEIVSITSGKTQADLETDRLLNLALLHLITIIGEAASRLPNDERIKYPEIQWAQISGMRNHIVHEYDDVDYDILWETVAKDIPHLIIDLTKIISPENS